MKRRLGFVAAAVVLFSFIVMAIPDALMSYLMAPTAAPLPKGPILRGLAVQGGFFDSRVDDLGRRLTILEVEQAKAREMDLLTRVDQATMKAKIDALFELMRVVIGAVIVYLIQVVGQAIAWVHGRRLVKES